AVNGGPIEVDGVEGEIEIENTNGRIAANDVAGSVVAHSQNGSVVVTMRQVTPGKPMAFSAMNWPRRCHAAGEHQGQRENAFRPGTDLERLRHANEVAGRTDCSGRANTRR